MILNNNGKVGLRYDTKANWEKFNPILDKGEMIVEQDNGKCYLKVGDGKSKYNNLAYIYSKESNYANTLRSNAPENSSILKIHPLPYVHYNLVDPTHTDSVYFKELLKWICRNYPNFDENNIFIGNVCPNSQGVCLIHIYDTSILKDGLPQHSTGTYFGYNKQITLFGTADYEYYILIK